MGPGESLSLPEYKTPHTSLIPLPGIFKVEYPNRPPPQQVGTYWHFVSFFLPGAEKEKKIIRCHTWLKRSVTRSSLGRCCCVWRPSWYCYVVLLLLVEVL